MTTTTATRRRRTRRSRPRSTVRRRARQSRVWCCVSFTAPFLYPPPNRLDEPPPDDVGVELPPPPKREPRAFAAPPLPESLTDAAVTVPLLAVTPETTIESPGWIAPEPTDCDLVTF